MDTATKTGIYAAKTTSKRVVQKTAEATGDLIGNKIADQITSRENKRKRRNLYSTRKKDNKLLMTQDYFKCKFYFLCIKIEFQKITNFLDKNSDNKDLRKVVTKKWIEVYDQSEKNYNPNKKIRIKTSMLRSDLCDFNNPYIVLKRNIIVNKKTFTDDDFEEPNKTAAIATAFNNANNNAFNENKIGF